MITDFRIGLMALVFPRQLPMPGSQLLHPQGFQLFLSLEVGINKRKKNKKKSKILNLAFFWSIAWFRRYFFILDSCLFFFLGRNRVFFCIFSKNLLFFLVVSLDSWFCFLFFSHPRYVDFFLPNYRLDIKKPPPPLSVRPFICLYVRYDI